MRIILSSLLSVSLLIHAVLGCCWHHAHESDNCHGTPVSLVAAGDCDHDHGTTPDGHRSHKPCDRHSHCQATCNYLPVQKSRITDSQLHLSIDPAIVAVLVGGSEVTAQCRLAGTRDVCLHPPV